MSAPRWYPGAPVPPGEHPSEHYACPACGLLPCNCHPICEECNGEGVVEINRVVYRHGVEFAEDVPTTCDACDGSGLEDDQ